MFVFKILILFFIPPLLILFNNESSLLFKEEDSTKIEIGRFVSLSNDKVESKISDKSL